MQPISSVTPLCIWSPWQQCWMPICLSLTDSFVGKNKSPVRINNELYICNVSRFEMRRDSASCQSWLGQNQTRIGKVVAIACSMLWMSDCLRSTDCFVGKNESPIPSIYEIYKGTVSRFKENRNWASSQFYLVKIGQELTKLWPFSRFNRQSESESALNWSLVQTWPMTATDNF